MILVYILCFFLSVVGIILILRLTPERVTEDLIRAAAGRRTLRSRSLQAKGKKKSHQLSVELHRIYDALEAAGKGNLFTLVIAASALLLLIGSVIAVSLGNVFLIPVFACAFALLPFIMARRTVRYYEKHIGQELETALSVITNSYIRSDDIVLAVKENLEYLKPPLKEIFAAFVAENTMITADIRQALRGLKEKINHAVFREWCDTAIACQDDRTLKDTLMPVVAKLTDIRLVNSEVRGIMTAARTEYGMMAAMVAANLPILYVLNREWYQALTGTVAGKLVLGLCGMTILVTALMMLRFTKPIEYR
ncbi:MAG: hypothetical protein DBY04_01260 [Clostridiales bacterium]|nr:MAG: hypothetical protein DBY04_01260 [Clostridiales bacterium]